MTAATLSVRGRSGSAGRCTITTGRPSARAASILPCVAEPPAFLATSQAMWCCCSKARSSAMLKGPRPSTTVCRGSGKLPGWGASTRRNR